MKIFRKTLHFNYGLNISEYFNSFYRLLVNISVYFIYYFSLIIEKFLKYINFETIFRSSLDR